MMLFAWGRRNRLKESSGYSQLFLGDYLQKAGVMPAPDLFYLQYSFKW